MCQAGTFKLAKLISNKKVVFQSVSEYDRGNGVKKCRSGYQSTNRKGIGSLLGHRKRYLHI